MLSFSKPWDEGGTENLTKSLGEGSLPSLREVADYVNREGREEGDFSVSLTDESLSQQGEVLTDETGQNIFAGREFNLKEIDRPSRAETEKAQKEGYEGAYNPLSLKEGKVEAMFFDNTPLRRVFGKQSGIIEQSAKPYLLNKHIQKVQETLNIQAPTQFVRELYQNARAFGQFDEKGISIGERLRFDKKRGMATTFIHEGWHSWVEAQPKDVQDRIHKSIERMYPEEVERKLKQYKDRDLAIREVAADHAADLYEGAGKSLLAREFKNFGNAVRDIFGVTGDLERETRDFIRNRKQNHAGSQR